GPEPRLHERSPRPCQHTYTALRSCVLAFLTRPRRTLLSRGIQSAARVAFLVLDLIARWLMDIGDTLVGNRGYLFLGSVGAVALAFHGLFDTKATQEETRASLERSLFVTLVSSGNAASFVAAMKDFGPTQTIRATEHPSLLTPWRWGQTS